MGVSVYWPLSVLYMCVISNQSTSKKPHHVSDLSKLDTLLHKTRFKVLKLDMCTSMISLSKIAHQKKSGTITDSAKETRRQNEQWGWGWK